MANARRTWEVTASPREPLVDSGKTWVAVGAAFVSLLTAFGIAWLRRVPRGDARRVRHGPRGGRCALLAHVAAVLRPGRGHRCGSRPVRLAAGPARQAPPPLAFGLVGTARAGSLGIALGMHGIGVGIGVACAYVPMVALVGAWFERRRTLALGVAVAGIGVGTLALPPAAALIERADRLARYLPRPMAGAGGTVLALCAFAAAAPRWPSIRVARGSGRRCAPDYRWLYLARPAPLGGPLRPVRAPGVVRRGARDRTRPCGWAHRQRSAPRASPVDSRSAPSQA